MIRPLVLVVLGLIGCGGGEPAHEPAELASLRFDVPSEWTRSDWHHRGIATSQWVPQDNDRKESIAIIRSERSPATANAAANTLEQLLAASQRSLRNVRASKAIPIKTAHGLVGARIDVDFVPNGLSERYHRVHVVLSDANGTLVHVLYTAKTPDGDVKALSIVLDSIRHEEA
jgi:hypothetical protein